MRQSGQRLTRRLGAPLPAVAAAREADGCLDFAVSADPVEPRRVNVFERWRSRELLDAFRGHGPDDGIRSRILEANIAEYAIG